MNLLLWIILGFLAGWIASLYKNDKNQAINVTLGVLGALIGGFIMNFLSRPGPIGLNFYSIFISIIGAVVLIRIGRFIERV